jgi:ribose transport system permease protein
MIETSSQERHRILHAIQRHAGRQRGLLAMIVVLGVWMAYPPRDASGQAIWPDLRQQQDVIFERAQYGILAAGMTLVILTGGIDLSVGSLLGMTAMCFSIFVCWWHWPAWAAVAAALAVATLAGAINGLLVAYGRMQPFAATLAMMVFARGVAKIVSGGAKVQAGAGEGSPWIFTQIAYTPWLRSDVGDVALKLSVAALLFPASILVLWIVSRYTRFGRYLFAIGGNEEAARLSGIRVQLSKVSAYAICGLTAGLAGLCNTARLDQGDPEAGATFELDAIAAVVIGGTSLMGGRGGVGLTLIGALIVGYVEKYLSILGWSLPARLMAKGVIIVVAVLIQGRGDKH